MMRGIIVGDNFCDFPRTSIARTNGAHRVAGLLRQHNIIVEVLDFFNSWTIDELKIILLRYKIDFIGLSLGLGQLDDTKINEFIILAKTMYPNIKVIAGGNQVLYNKIANIDLNFKGFADGAIEDIVTYLTTGFYPSDKVNEISIDDHRKVIDCNHHYSKFDLSNLRTEYTYKDFLSPNENFTLETGRGCIFKCKFCNFPLIGKNKNDYIRCKDDLKKEIVDNYNRWGITRYSITDDTFNDNEIKVDILYEISQEIDFTLSFMCYARVDLLHARPGSLDKMISFGVKGMHFGIESMTPETSRAIGKGFTGEKLKDYLRLIKQTYPDLHLTGSFIVGLPNETIEQTERNVNYAIDNGLLDAVPMFALNIPKETGGADISIFSKEWHTYGYQELSKAEIELLLEDDKYESFRNLDFEKLSNHNVLWKSEHMNVFDAELAVHRIKQAIAEKTTMGGWNCFTTTYSGIPLETLLKLKRPQWDWEHIKNKATEFIHDYKIKKIDAY